MSMANFTYYNPVKIIFGRGAIAQLAQHIPAAARIMLVYGGGSIKKNGVYRQVLAALAGRKLTEFGGIEPNPRYETCMRAVAQAQAAKIDFLLAAGGGSVLDGVKFMAAALRHPAGDPWDFLLGRAAPRAAVPLGCVLTLPATGSEMNSGAVISRQWGGRMEKLFFLSDHVFPRFSILDPETTFSLPPRQTANGIVDAFVHVMEQYLTCPAGAPLQDRQSEAILTTLMEEAPKVMRNPADYDARANIMWCAAQALNGLVGCGVPQDWTTHGIGHELTALYGLDHARTLALIWPCVMRHQLRRKRAKLLQYAERVLGLRDGGADERVCRAIGQTVAFFRSLGMGTTMAECRVPETAPAAVAERLAARNVRLGEQGDLDSAAVAEIIALAR